MARRWLAVSNPGYVVYNIYGRNGVIYMSAAFKKRDNRCRGLAAWCPKMTTPLLLLCLHSTVIMHVLTQSLALFYRSAVGEESCLQVSQELYIPLCYIMVPHF